MESSPWRFFNRLRSFITKPLSPLMMILERVCRFFSSPIPNGIFSNNGVPLMSKCRNLLSFKKLLGNFLNLTQPEIINVCK
ncbi:hypothetical protein Hanom_Chr09g00815851 [Helianthus anomalus]